MIEAIKSRILAHQSLKRFLHSCLIHPYRSRPRWWVRRLLMPILTKRGKGSYICRSVRRDVTPFHPFIIGIESVIEDFSTINNAVGILKIGDHSRVGLNNTIIGPVVIGNHVQLAQSVVISGLNHNYEDIFVPIDSQGVSTAPITIEDDVWIGANVSITAGVTIGTHSIVAAGSVVTRSVPPHSVVAGVPARVVKEYDFNTHQWTKPLSR